MVRKGSSEPDDEELRRSEARERRRRRRRQRAPWVPRRGTLLAWLIILTVAILVSGYFHERETRLVPFLVFFPALIAGLGTVWETVFAAVWVNAVTAAVLIERPLATTGGNVSVILFSVAAGIVSVLASLQRARKEERFTQLRSAAVALQREILRPLPVRTDEVVVTGHYHPVEENQLVGGDIYEVVPSAYGTRVLIADVQGKGLPAIGAAFAVLGAFREAAHREPTLTAVVDALEAAVHRRNGYARMRGEPERFVTALVLSIGAGHKAQAVNCGHIPPYQLPSEDGSGSRRARPVLSGVPNLPLGLDVAGASHPRTIEWFDFPPGVTLLLCTDGVTEAQDRSGAFYPLEERLTAWGDIPLAQVVPTLHKDLERYTRGHLRDDTAVLVVRRNPVPALPDGGQVTSGR